MSNAIQIVMSHIPSKVPTIVGDERERGSNGNPGNQGHATNNDKMRKIKPLPTLPYAKQVSDTPSRRSLMPCPHLRLEQRNVVSDEAMARNAVIDHDIKPGDDANHHDGGTIPIHCQPPMIRRAINAGVARVPMMYAR